MRIADIKLTKRHFNDTSESVESKFSAQDFINARKVASKEILGRYVLAINDTANIKRKYRSRKIKYYALRKHHAFDNLCFPQDRLPAANVPPISYWTIAMPQKHKQLSEFIHMGKPGCGNYVDVPNKIKSPGYNRIDKAKRTLARKEILAAIGETLSVMKAYGADPGGMTPEKVWRRQIAWDDTLAFPQAAYDLAAANIDRQIKKLHSARLYANTAHTYRLTLALWGAFCLAVLLQLALGVRLRTFAVFAALLVLAIIGLEVWLLVHGFGSPARRLALLFATGLSGAAAGLLWLGCAVVLPSRKRLLAKAALVAGAGLPAVPALGFWLFKWQGRELLFPYFDDFPLALIWGVLLYFLVVPFLQQTLEAARAQPETKPALAGAPK